MRTTAALTLRRCSVTDASGEARLEAASIGVGEDLVVVVGGGERYHVGAAALAISIRSLKDPRVRTTSSYLASVPGHKEEALAREGALLLARALERQVVVTVGIHDDAIPRHRIQSYLALFDRLMRRVIALEKREGRAGGRPTGRARAPSRRRRAVRAR